MTSFFTKASEFLFAISLLHEMMLVNTAVKTGAVELDTTDKPDRYSLHPPARFWQNSLAQQDVYLKDFYKKNVQGSCLKFLESSY